MGSERRFFPTPLFFLAFLAFSSVTDGSPLEVLSAPNLLRIGTSENIFVEIQDCPFANNVVVEISVKNFPTQEKLLAQTSVTLTQENKFQAFGQIKLPVYDFGKDPRVKQYVYLKAQFPNRVLEKVVLVSMQSGYIFIQTDKPIYTPNSYVHFRLFGVQPTMEPIDRGHENPVLIEIVTPGHSLYFGHASLSQSGLFTDRYRLSEIASPGQYKVLARFQNNPEVTFAAEFEVKEYAMPSFEVKLTPESSFFYVDRKTLTLNIEAKYHFGKAVDGTAFVIFGVIQNGQKQSFHTSLQRVPIVGGNGVATLEREQIQTFRDIKYLMGSSIFAAVTVLTEHGGEMAERELRGVKIVSSPYSIHFKKTVKYFKPGMPVEFEFQVLNPDNSPAKFLNVVVDPGHMQAQTGSNGMARVPINTEKNRKKLAVTVKTSDPHITPERQASATIEALPYTSASNSYIYIVANTAEVNLGDKLRINCFLSRQESLQNDLTYLILSRGQLVKHGRYQIQQHLMVSLIVPITKEMLPSFRLIVYYHTNDGEVVSDSLWVDVKASCTVPLRLENARPASSYDPRRSISLKITGEPEATVGLVMVDKGVALNDRHLLTQEKVWDIIEKYEPGCTVGGGKDAMSVFYDAGLLFESSASGTPHRQDLGCPSHSKRKRDVTNTSLSEVEEDSYMDTSDIFSRSAFSKSWLWSDVTLPSCSRKSPNCETTSVVKNTRLQDSITGWKIIAISLSKTGICVAEPLEVIVKKEFFIDLILPYSAVIGEQLEIKTIIHNESPDPATVLVTLFATDHLCSVASQREKYRQEVKVESKSARSVPFILLPTKIGEHSIEIKASVKDSFLSDGITKVLRVQPDGLLTNATTTIILDPAKNGGQQEQIINSQIPLKDVLPKNPAVTLISLTGEKTGVPWENTIDGSSMSALIIQPSGNGKANMIHMTLLVIATIYLDKTNQWDTVGFDMRKEALQHILKGYQNELAYRKTDSSFTDQVGRQSSTWLTAYVAKVFKMANNLVPVARNVICDAIRFLILHRQQPDGMFREDGSVSQDKMTGDVFGADSDISLTAFCLIAMQESRHICVDSVNSLLDSIWKAVTYLENRLPSLINPYAVAMTSYALANENKLNREILYRFASSGLNHWPVSKGTVYTLEATAYALLALVRSQAFEEAKPVIRWLSQQQRINGGYGSTQATLMVYQAVAEYWSAERDPEYNLDILLLLPDRSKPEIFNFNPGNYYSTRTARFYDINRDVKVTARGKGRATLTMTTLYYKLPEEPQSDCQMFNLSVQLLPESDVNMKTYKLRIAVLYMDRERDATISVLDIGLLTGFTVNTKDLDLLSKGSGRVISKYEMNTALSERGSLIIYLDKVSHTRPEEITFRIHQVVKMGVLQPAAVSVYEYYDSKSPCVKFYHPERSSGQLLQLCRNEECTCAEENCSMQKKGKINTDERTQASCDITPTRRTDFMYKVRVEEFTESLSTDVYTMRVQEVIKEGNYDLAPLGKLRAFFSFANCRAALDLVKGKTYLIMGTSRDIHVADQLQSYQYVLSERTWIEYWPTSTECLTDEHKLTCLGLEETVTQYQLFGCTM